MMFSQYRPRDALMLRAALAGLWTVELATAIGSVIDPGASLVDRYTAQWSFIVGGILTALASVLALSGIVRGRWRHEWVGAVLAPLGVVPYVVTAWWVFLEDGFGMARAITAAFLILFPLYRQIHCLAHSNRIRDLATPSEPIRPLTGKDDL